VNHGSLSDYVLGGIPVFLTFICWLTPAFIDDSLQFIERFLVRCLPEGTLLGPYIVAKPPVHQQSWVLTEYGRVARGKRNIEGWVFCIQIVSIEGCGCLGLGVDADADCLQIIFDLWGQLFNPGVVRGQQRYRNIFSASFFQKRFCCFWVVA